MERLQQAKNAIADTTLDKLSLEIFPEYYKKYPDSYSRGVNHGVMHNLWCMVRTIGNHDKCIYYATDTIAYVLTLIRIEYGRKLREDIANQETVERMDYVAFDVQLWLALADRIEECLKQKSVSVNHGFAICPRCGRAEARPYRS